MRARGIRTGQQAAPSGAWIGGDAVVSTGDPAVVEWAVESQLAPRPGSLYQVVVWGEWWTVALTGGAEGTIAVDDWLTVYVAHDMDDPAGEDIRSFAGVGWLRTGARPPTALTPTVTATLTGSSSGAAALHVGAVGLIVRRVQLAGQVAGLDPVVVDV